MCDVTPRGRTLVVVHTPRHRLPVWPSFMIASIINPRLRPFGSLALVRASYIPHVYLSMRPRDGLLRSSKCLIARNRMHTGHSHEAKHAAKALLSGSVYRHRLRPEMRTSIPPLPPCGRVLGARSSCRANSASSMSINPAHPHQMMPWQGLGQRDPMWYWKRDRCGIGNPSHRLL